MYVHIDRTHTTGLQLLLPAARDKSRARVTASRQPAVRPLSARMRPQRPATTVVTWRARVRLLWLVSVLLFPALALSPPGSLAAVIPGATAIVTATDGDLLALREGPGVDRGYLTGLAAGTVVNVLDGPRAAADGYQWFKVEVGGLVGWCAGEYLAGAAAPPPVVYTVGGTDGDGVRLRDGPALDATILVVLPEGTTLTVSGPARSADGIDWAPVDVPGASGWVATPFLTPAAGAPPLPRPGQSGLLAAGDHAAVVGTDGEELRIRGGAGLDTLVRDYAPAGAVLLIEGEPRADDRGAAWYGVNFGGIRGWVLGRYLAKTDQQLSPYLGGQDAAKQARRGAAIAQRAREYAGAPYVWGGTSPAGWDCSGFIMFVYSEVAGMTLPRTTYQQFEFGSAVEPGAIQAGDLVFFADTGAPGVSHNGIALGDGTFVHARSEQYGTMISALADPYWSAHFAGARRP